MALWFVHSNPAGFRGDKITRINLDREPSPAIMAEGIYGDCHSHYWLEDDDDMATRVIHDTGNPAWSAGDVTDVPCPAILASPRDSAHYLIETNGHPESPRGGDDQSKPPYRVPSMKEIEAIPWNGFKVASTFSGTGGSCLGYRMAGFRVVWANEFVPVAQDSYRANMHEGAILDGRDIKLVKPEEILEATGLKAGELDLFDGSPPCQAFSTAGRREKGWGKEKVYEHGAAQCNETLFDEYIRLLRGLKPKTFIAENVSGLVKGTAKGYFLDILKELKASGYRVKAKLLDAQWLGVPQMRHRIIFIGVREDLGFDPVFPQPLAYRYSVRDALPWINKVRRYKEVWGDGADHPSPAIGSSDAKRGTSAKFSAGGWVEADSTDNPIEPECDMTGYATGREWDRMGKPGTQSDKYFSLMRPALDKPCPTVTTPPAGSVHAATVCHPTERRKFTIAELKRICAFPDDFELKGTYAQQWERLGNSVPPLMMKAIAEAVRDNILQPTRTT